MVYSILSEKDYGIKWTMKGQIKIDARDLAIKVLSSISCSIKQAKALSQSLNLLIIVFPVKITMIQSGMAKIVFEFLI